jgi:hypothetical protein
MRTVRTRQAEDHARDFGRYSDKPDASMALACQDKSLRVLTVDDTAGP